MDTYIVRTMHDGNAFIVPVALEAMSSHDAAISRFNTLSKDEQKGCRALLVEQRGLGEPQLFEVEETTPAYNINPA